MVGLAKDEMLGRLIHYQTNEDCRLAAAVKFRDSLARECKVELGSSAGEHDHVILDMINDWCTSRPEGTALYQA